MGVKRLEHRYDNFQRKKLLNFYSLILFIAIVPFLYYNNKKYGYYDTCFSVLTFYVLLSGSIGIINGIKNRKNIIRIDKLLTLAFVVIFITTVIHYKRDSLFLPISSFKYLIAVGVGICLRMDLKDIKHNYDKKVFTSSIAIILILNFFIGIFQIYINDFKLGLSVQGPLNNSGTLANYILCVFSYPLCYYIFSDDRNTRIKNVCFVASILGIVIIAITLARASWIGCLCAIVFIWLAKYGSTKKIYITTFVTIFVVITMVAIVSFVLSSKHQSALGRIHIFEVGMSMLKAGFPFGLGIGSIYAHFNDFQSTYFLIEHRSIDEQLVATNTFEVFNSIQQVAIEFGILGLLFYFITIKTLFKIAGSLLSAKVKNPLEIGAMSSLVGLFVSSLLSNPFHHWPIVFTCLCSLSLLSLPYYKMVLKNLTIKLYYIFSAGIVIYTCYWYTSRLYAMKQWNTAAEYALNNDFNQARILYDTAYEYLSDNEQFLYNYGSELCINEHNYKAIELLEEASKYYSSSELYTYLGIAFEQAGQYNKSLKQYKKASYIVPSKFYPRFKLFKLYLKMNDHINALSTGKKILDMTVKIPSSEVTEIKDIVKLDLLIISQKTDRISH